MSEIAWQLEHSVEARVNPAFAWDWQTDVRNWDDPPSEFRLDGPFAAGARGTTMLPGQAPVQWQIRHVTSGQSYIIDTLLDAVTLSFEWRFDALSNGRTKLTQRIVLTGANAASRAAQVQGMFGATLSAGMSRIAACMERAEASAKNGED